MKATDMKPVTLKTWLFALLLLLSTSSLAQTFLDSDAFQALEPGAQKAIELIVQNDEVAAFLERYPDWRAEAYIDNEPDWKVDFYQGDEWFAAAHINIETGEVYDAYYPHELSEEAFNATRDDIDSLVLNDAELENLLGDFNLWEHEVRYDAYEQSWWVDFWRGIDAFKADIGKDGERFYVDQVYDPEAFDEEEAQRVARDQAVELAWQAEGIGEALDGVDDWHAYAEPQGDGRWTVEFASYDHSLFTALVDIDNWEVLEAEAP